ARPERASVASAFTVNMLIKPRDSVLVEFTNDAIRLVDLDKSISLTLNIWFSVVADGASAEVKFDASHACPPFKLADDAPAVRHAKRAAESIGMKPNAVYSNGGLDANWLVKRGLPTVTIGAGQNEVHTVKEYVHLPEFANGCRLAVALATFEG